MIINIKLQGKDQIWKRLRVYFGNSIQQRGQSCIFERNLRLDGYYEFEVELCC